MSPSGSIRRRTVLAGGVTLLTSLSGCSDWGNQAQSAEQSVPPLIGAEVTNQTQQTLDFYLLVQGNSGEVTYWKEDELSAAAPDEGTITNSWVVQFVPPCYSDFLVSVSIDAGETWHQIGPTDYRRAYDDFPTNQGCSPGAVILEKNEVEFESRLSIYDEEQCGNNSETTGTVQGLKERN